MKSFEITPADHTAAAGALTGGTVASKDALAQAVKRHLGHTAEAPVTVIDAGSFYADTDKGNMLFAGGYEGAQAKKLRKFLAASYDEQRAMLPIKVEVSEYRSH